MCNQSTIHLLLMFPHSLSWMKRMMRHVSLLDKETNLTSSEIQIFRIFLVCLIDRVEGFENNI